MPVFVRVRLRWRSHQYGAHFAPIPSVPAAFRIIGRGIYSMPEAERLTGVPQKRIRRWTQGYRYWSGARRVFSPPVIASEAQEAVGIPALDFSDLIEIRFLDAFRKHGVSWQSIRIAALHARELLGRHRPFSSRIFKTDGRTILAEIVPHTGDRMLMDLVRNQYEFERIVSPLLYAGLEFNDLDEPERWWPLGEQRQVVLDPMRAFGAPIISRYGVPTRVLADAVLAEESSDVVAQLYEVDATAVGDAVEFESHLRA